MSESAPFVSLLELDRRDLDELLSLIGEVPHRHALALNAFFDGVYARSEQRKQALLDEYNRLLAEHRATIDAEKPIDRTTLH